MIPHSFYQYYMQNRRKSEFLIGDLCEKQSEVYEVFNRRFDIYFQPWFLMKLKIKLKMAPKGAVANK